MYSYLYDKVKNFSEANKFKYFSTHSFGSYLEKLPRKAVRVRNAIASMAFIVCMALSADYMTSSQIKNSPYYKYSLEAVKKNPKVISEIGDDIIEPWHITLKKRKKYFNLEYKVKGKSTGKVLIIQVGGTIDPYREYIAGESYRYIIAKKRELSLRQNFLTDIINSISSAIGDTNLINESEKEKERSLESQIVIVNNISPKKKS